MATVLDEYFDEFEEHCDDLVRSLFNIADSEEFSGLLYFLPETSFFVTLVKCILRIDFIMKYQYAVPWDADLWVTLNSNRKKGEMT